MLCTVKELRQLGFQVRIKHERHFRFKKLKLQDLFVTKGEIKFDDKKTISNIVKDIKADLDIYVDEKATKEVRGKAIRNLFEIDNNDGMTTVSIYHGDELLGSGNSKVNESVGENGKRDAFNKKFGLKTALTRALQHAHELQKINLGVVMNSVVKLRENKQEIVE